MKKTKYIATALFALFALSSCGVGLDEIYDGPAYEEADFSKNYYRAYPDSFKNADIPLINTFVLDSDEKAIEYGDSPPINPQFSLDLMMNDVVNFGELAIEASDILESYEIANYEYELALLEYNEILNNPNVPDPVERPRPPVPFIYADQYYEAIKLGNTDETFKKGYFSKLTDGLTYCDGSGARARIQTDEDGFAVLFDKELIEYHSLIVAFRGATDIPWGEIGQSKIPTAQIKLHLDFYMQNMEGYNKVRFSFTGEVATDTSTHTNILSVNLDEFLLEYPDLLKQMRGVGISYELLEHELIKPEGALAEEDYEFALMMYEFALPYSQWN